MLEVSATYENDIDEQGFAIVEDVSSPTKLKHFESPSNRP